MTKKLLVTLLAMMCCMVAVAQNLRVESFRELTTDMSARIEAPRRDQNGEWCALIKVVSNVLGDLEFQASGLGIVKIEKHTGETWLYIPADSKNISLFHPFCGTLRNYNYPMKIAKQMVYEMSVIGNTEGMTIQTFSNVIIKVDGNAEIFVNGTSKGNGTWAGMLSEGDYEVECRLDNCVPSKRTIHVTAGHDEDISMDRPAPFSGKLHVTSTPSSARVILDGKDMGVTTPCTIDNILIGSHNIELSLENNNTDTREVSINRDETANVDFTFGGDVTIKSRPSGATLMINGKEVSHTPYTTYLTLGDYSVTLEKENYKTVTKTVRVETKPLVKSFTLPYKKYFRPNTVYANLGGQFGSSSSLGISLGGYLSNVNVEASYLMGMGKSENLYWNYNGGTSREPITLAYSNKAYELKIGYGIEKGKRMRITPQVGVKIVSINGSGNGETSECNVTSGVVSARFDYALKHGIGFFAAPEVNFAMSKSPVYEQLSKASSTIKGWGTGFNLRAGVIFFY